MISDNARSGHQRSIYSPSFYSSPTGYKMCLRLYPNGDADVRGEYLSVFLNILKCDHDDHLQWPFPFEVNIRLVDQSTGNNHVVKSFCPNVNSDSCRKPIVNMNEAFGLKKYVPCSYLQQNMHCFVKDDIMLIEININSQSTAVHGSSPIGQVPNDRERTVPYNQNSSH